MVACVIEAVMSTSAVVPLLACHVAAAVSQVSASPAAAFDALMSPSSTCRALTATSDALVLTWNFSVPESGKNEKDLGFYIEDLVLNKKEIIICVL
jgi:hypothetical protein